MALTKETEKQIRGFLERFFVASNKYELFETFRLNAEDNENAVASEQFQSLPFISTQHFEIHKQEMICDFFNNDQNAFGEFWRVVSNPPHFANYLSFQTGIFERKDDFVIKIWDLKSRLRDAHAFTLLFANGVMQIDRWNYKISQKMCSDAEAEFPRPIILPTKWKPESLVDKLLSKIFGKPN